MSDPQPARYQVRVAANGLDDAVCARLEVLAGKLSLETPVEPGSDGVWVAARDLARRDAQSLRRQLGQLGLHVDVADQSEVIESAPHAVEPEDDLGLIPWDDDAGEANETAEQSAADEEDEEDESGGADVSDRQAQLLSWFGGVESEPSPSSPGPPAKRDAEGADLDLLEPDLLEPDLLESGPQPLESDPGDNRAAAIAPPSIAEAQASSAQPLRATPAPPPVNPMGNMVQSLSARSRNGAGADKPSFGASADSALSWRVIGIFAAVVGVALVLVYATGLLSDTDAEAEGSETAGPSKPAGDNTQPNSYELEPDPEPLETLEGEPVEEPPSEAEVAAQQSDKAAAAELFAEGEAKCRLQRYEECVLIMEAVTTLDPDHGEAFNWIIKSKSDIELRDNPPAPLGPVEPKVIVIGPDTPRDGAEETPKTPHDDPKTNPDPRLNPDAPDPNKKSLPPAEGGAGVRSEYTVDEAGNPVLILPPPSTPDAKDPSTTP